jgi:ligand-binding sensor domain-containing protein/signal transduction histidine kinase
LCVALQIGCLQSSSQIPNPVFIRITPNEGLSQGHVNNILKDRKGFMWFATDGGLNKYDGYSFKVYKNQLSNATTISNDFVLDLAEDREGSLWVGTASGLDNFDSKKDIFLHYRPGKDVSINDVLIDKKNNIWLGTTSGLYLFDKQNKSFTGYAWQPNNINSLSNNHIYHLVEDNGGCIWIATKDGLNCFNPITRQFTVYKGNPASANGLQTNWIRSLYKDHKGIIWIGTIGSGVARFDSASQQFVPFKHNPFNSNSLAHNDVLSFAEDEHNNLWIGTENGGISILNHDTNQFTTIANDPTDPQSLGNNSVYALYKDDIGNMWAGTWANGASMLPVIGKKFSTYTQVPGKANSLSNPSVLSMMADDKGDVWIGTDGGGLNRFNIKTKQFTHYLNEGPKSSPLQNNFIISVIKAGSNLLALGYHRGSIDIFNTVSEKVVRHISIIDAVDKKFELSANCLFMDRANNLWIGTWGGGVYMLNNEYKIVANYLHSTTDSNSINSDFINCIMQDKEGAIWVGTDEGLNKLNSGNGNFIQYRHNLQDQTTISHNEINDIFEDKSGRLWIGSAGGLDLLDKQKAKLISFTKDDGLPSNAIQAIEEDRNGLLWLSTDNGMAAFNTVTKKSKNYSTDDGLQGREFKNNCSFVNKEGLMFFGGNYGFNYFRPDSLRENQFVPPVYITDFQIFNKSQFPGNKDSVLSGAITETEQIILSYKQSVISFEFAALNFIYSDKNQYAYMLEGFDKDWIYAGTHRTATYTNLDAGGYTFKVKASNNDGIWNEKGTSIRLIVTPPYWKTWWFYLLVVLAVISLALLFANYRIKTVQQQKIILQQQVKKQTAQLVKFNIEETTARKEAEKLRAEADDANKKLIASNQQMEQFAYVASHDLKEPLRTTTSFINLLQKKYKGRLDEQADKYIYFITNASERMKVLIDDLLQFSRIGSNKRLSKIDCNDLFKMVLQDIDVAVKETNSVVKVSHLPEINGYATELKLLFQNLLVNAIKFRKKELAPNILVAAEDKGSYWQFSVKDNGIGIAPEFKEKIFMIFQRLHGMTEYEGSGIGLAHCHKIVGLHNGKIWVESEPGAGSVFYFSIAKNIT